MRRRDSPANNPLNETACPDSKTRATASVIPPSFASVFSSAANRRLSITSGASPPFEAVGQA